VTHRGPVITAIVVVGGLVGFMTANSAGALVVSNASDQKGVEVLAPPAAGQQGQGQGKQPPGSSDSDKPPAKAPEKPKAPPAPTFPAEAMYAGDATGSDLAIAVAVKGKQASAYLCDGDAVEDWLKGTADAGKLELTSKNGESTLTGELKGKRLAGTVEFRGQSRPFSIAVGAPPAGLYRGENGKTTIGWIILPNGQQVGISNADGDESPAPMLDPDQGYVMVGGMRVDAEKVTGESTW
jgi:hypothetical protein